MNRNEIIDNLVEDELNRLSENLKDNNNNLQHEEHVITKLKRKLKQSEFWAEDYKNNIKLISERINMLRR